MGGEGPRICMLRCVCDNLRTICGGQFAPSTMDVLGIRLSGSAASTFTHETILPALSRFKSFVNLILLWCVTSRVWVEGGSCHCVHMEIRRQLRVLVIPLLPWVWRDLRILWFSIVNARLAVPQASPIFTSRLPARVLASPTQARHLVFTWILGIQTQEGKY